MLNIIHFIISFCCYALLIGISNLNFKVSSLSITLTLAPNKLDENAFATVILLVETLEEKGRFYNKDHFVLKEIDQVDKNIKKFRSN